MTGVPRQAHERGACQQREMVRAVACSSSIIASFLTALLSEQCRLETCRLEPSMERKPPRRPSLLTLRALLPVATHEVRFRLPPTRLTPPPCHGVSRTDSQARSGQGRAHVAEVYTIAITAIHVPPDSVPATPITAGCRTHKPARQRYQNKHTRGQTSTSHIAFISTTPPPTTTTLSITTITRATLSQHYSRPAKTVRGVPSSAVHTQKVAGGRGTPGGAVSGRKGGGHQAGGGLVSKCQPSQVSVGIS